jgi:hypothetical protein
MTCVPGVTPVRAERSASTEPNRRRNRYRLQLTRKNVSNINTDHNGAL